ncbi:uncharacterized protein LOC131023174 [Salvia miltiorrhiza]|uniref:uncharacterized protein LOC131023174 n=1 Tax=Salvia miltiorrhiza TaxID=226208 RepID=UPI0025AC2C5A|nr:uncharacterized protein LOC131023174 [Salvia miltiorrhiza]
MPLRRAALTGVWLGRLDGSADTTPVTGGGAGNADGGVAGRGGRAGSAAALADWHATEACGVDGCVAGGVWLSVLAALTGWAAVRGGSAGGWQRCRGRAGLGARRAGLSGAEFGSAGLDSAELIITDFGNARRDELSRVGLGSAAFGGAGFGRSGLCSAALVKG